MEVVGAAVNIASAADFAIKGIHAVKKYVKNVETAEGRCGYYIDVLHHETDSLKNFQTLQERLQREPSLRHSESLRVLRQASNGRTRESRTFPEEMEKVSRYLEKQSSERGRGQDETAPRKDEKTPQREGKDNSMSAGKRHMSFLQKLKWPMKGNRKPKKLINQLNMHKERCSLALQVVQR